MKSNGYEVKVWEQEIEIPTYPVGEADKNPMFLEKRVYQGSSGKVYPHPVIDKIHNEKVNQKYQAVFLENEYLQIMILPEIGGRIQRALDKTNNYDFVYYNHVIKPALVGLAGPWISGGIEFNWPQHHRPSTFAPVDYKLVEHPDGSKSVYVSEIEQMFRTKGMACYTLYPGKAYLEIKGQLYNRTSTPQTFLWWANPAVAVNEHTQSVFPPDVHAVFDHGKRDVSTFPIATGTYYKMDYSAGVDISRYKNIPVPTSYMAYRSDYDFVGGYDHQKCAGLLHIADHHVSPGKKQWTWGNGDFGQAWDRNLTDEDGPYIELMTGMFTDNQPDFSWIMPYEEKTFVQYFLPYKNAGVVKNATINVAVNLEVQGNRAVIDVYTTSAMEHVDISLAGCGKVFLKETVDVSPTNTYHTEVELEQGIATEELLLSVRDSNGKLLITYQPEKSQNTQIPEPAKAALLPSELNTNEELYLAGLHMEQYRHATYEAEEYYQEGLHRDEGDIRINNAFGSLLLIRGQFGQAERHFRKAIERMTKHNTNPYDGEAYYNLGLALKLQQRYDEAFDAFYKAIWNAAMKDMGYYSLACISSLRGEFEQALAHVSNALIGNWHNYKARGLKAAMLRKLGRLEEAEKLCTETIELDELDFTSRNERFKILVELGRQSEADDVLVELKRLMRDNINSYIEVSIDYADAGLYEEAIELLSRLVQTEESSPMLCYYLGWYNRKQGKPEEGAMLYSKGMHASPRFCFPNRLEDLLVLSDVLSVNPEDAKAYYYLGNLWYDKKQYPEAIDCWEKSKTLEPGYATVRRNLALAYYNKLGKAKMALSELEAAFALDKKDARVFLELDQLYKLLGVEQAQRLEKFVQNFDLVLSRDDLYLEYITMLNAVGAYDKAREWISSRTFHPWEGGEGKVPAQYVYCHVELAKQELAKQELDQRNYNSAIALLKDALVYPHNLGEGKLAGAQENNINYYLGCAYAALGCLDEAKMYLGLATQGLDEPAGMMYYNDQPADMIFYQGMAHLQLGNLDSANSKFNKLVDYGERHIHDKVKIDYFAVSLPDFLIFEQDLDRKNIVHCRYLMGLGKLGLGDQEGAKQEFEHVLTLDANHIGALTHRRMANND